MKSFQMANANMPLSLSPNFVLGLNSCRRPKQRWQ